MNLEPIAVEYVKHREQQDAAKVAVDESVKREDDLVNELEEAQIELDRLLDLEQNDHIKRVLDGDDAAPKKPKRLTRIANLQETIAGVKMALPVSKERTQKAREQLRQIDQAANQAVLPHLISLKSDLLRECELPLRYLIELLVSAAALDEAQDRFSASDRSFIVPEGIDPASIFSAKIILEKFKKNLPFRFTDLARDQLSDVEKHISERSAAIVAKIGASK